MAPNFNSTTNICAAVKLISTNLYHLRHEHSESKDALSTMFDQILIQQRHVNRIDELIHQQEAKIDELMQMVSCDQDAARVQESHAPIEQMSLQVPVSDWSSAPMPVREGGDWPVADTADAYDSDSPGSNHHQSCDRSGEIAIKLENTEDCSNTVAVPLAFSLEATTSAIDHAADQDVTESTSEPGRQASKRTTSQNHVTVNSSPKKQQQQQQRRRIRLKARGDLSLNSRIPGFDIPTKQVGVSNQLLAEYMDAARYFDIAGKVRYRCPVCALVFKAKTDCERHLLCKHTHEKPFKCSSCSYATSRKSNFVRHRISCKHQYKEL